MNRVWLLNSWFEWELDFLIRSGELPILTRPKRNRNVFLEKLFLALSEPNDYVVLQSPPSLHLLDHWRDINWEVSNRILDINSKDRFVDSFTDYELIEFGRVRSIQDSGIHPNPIVWKPSAFWNSRIAQAKYELEMGIKIGDIDSSGNIFIINSQLDLEDRLSSILEDNDGNSDSKSYLFKANYSSSGRGHILWSGIKDNHRLKKLDYPVLMENYHEDRSMDFGILLDFSSGEEQSGEVEFLGVSSMIIGKDFQFKGCVFYNSGEPEWLESIRKICMENIQSILSWQDFTFNTNDDPVLSNTNQSSLKYQGPASWDGYVLESGEIRFRSEINFRMSLGRIAWEIHKKRLRTGSSMCHSFGISILHSKEMNLQKVKDFYSFYLILSESDSEPWMILYWETQN